MTARTIEPIAAVRRLLAAVAIALLMTGSLAACDLSGMLGGESQEENGGYGGDGEEREEDGEDDGGEDD